MTVTGTPSKILSRHWYGRHRYGMIAAGLLVAIVVVAGVILATHWPFTQENVLKAMREDWPGSVQAGRFTSNYFPHPGCVIENLVLTIPSSRAQEPLTITVAKAQIQAGYADLFVRPGFLARLAMEGLRVEVPVYESSNTAPEPDKRPSQHSTTRLGEVETHDAVLIVKRANEKDPLTFAVHHLLLQSVRADEPLTYDGTVRNPLPPGEVHLRGQFGPWEGKDLKNLPLSASYTFDKADLGVFNGIAGMLSSAGAFHGVLGQIAMQGAVKVPDFEVTHSHHAVAVEAKYQAVVDATHGDIALQQVDASFLQTTVHAEGTIASVPGRPGKPVLLNLNIQQGRIQDVLDLFVKSKLPPMEGAAKYRARVELPPGPKPFVQKVVMEGSFSIEHAVLTKQERQNQIDELSKRASGKKDQQGTDRVSATLTGHLLLRDGTAVFSALSYSVPGAEVNMTGRYEIQGGKIDFHGDAKTQAEVSEQTSGIKAVLLKPLNPLFKKKNAGADVRVGMTGTFANPHFGVELPIKK